MIAKFTPFGKQDAGKSYTLRALIYLLYQNADLTCNVIINGVLCTPTKLSLSQIFSGKKDIRIIFTYQPVHKVIGICTGGDDDIIVRDNWDFFRNRKSAFAKMKKSNFWETPHFCISPCHQSGNSRDQEEYEEHIFNDMDFIYWFKTTSIDGKCPNPNDPLLSELYQAMCNNNVFKPYRSFISCDDAKKCIWLAEKIREKIEQLS